MTRLEKITTAVSVASLFISVVALLAPLWTHLIDRQVRGQFVVAWLSNDGTEVYEARTSIPKSDIKARVKNIGLKPVVGVVVQVERLKRGGTLPEVATSGYALKAPEDDGETAAYQLSSAIAPGQVLDIIVRGSNLRQILLSTEHGDTAVLYLFDGGFE